jgi:hypothetical protein
MSFGFTLLKKKPFFPKKFHHNAEIPTKTKVDSKSRKSYIYLLPKFHKLLFLLIK